MSARDRRTLALVSLALVASATAGCSQAPAHTAAAPSPAASSPAGPPSRDTRACLGAQALLGHVAADTARWSPQRQPFDKTMAERIRLSSADLAKQAPQAGSTKVRTAIDGIAESFRSLAAAMGKRDRGLVNTAMTRTRASYKALKSTCTLD